MGTRTKDDDEDDDEDKKLGVQVEAAGIEVSPPVAVRTEPHPTKEICAKLVGRAKLRLSRIPGGHSSFWKSALETSMNMDSAPTDN
jgi:hypothetical protein